MKMITFKKYKRIAKKCRKTTKAKYPLFKYTDKFEFEDCVNLNEIIQKGNLIKNLKKRKMYYIENAYQYSLSIHTNINNKFLYTLQFYKQHPVSFYLYELAKKCKMK